MKARTGVVVLAVLAGALWAGWHSGLIDTPREEAATGTGGAASKFPPSGTSASTPRVAEAPAPAPAAVEPRPVAPSFDVVRVEPDGAAVLAGRAAPNANLVLRSGETRLGEVRTDASGAFALDVNLARGQHRLALLEEGKAAPSGETALVNVPERGREGELLVMVERPGEASEILVKPEPQATPPVETAAAAQPNPAPDPASAAQAAQTPAAQTPAIQTPAAPTPSEQVAAAAPASSASDVAAIVPSAQTLAVEAVEAEGGKLFVAGAVEERAPVRVYLDGRLVSETAGGAGDRFIASAQAEVSVGDHVVRVDEVDGSGRVVARVEVPFNRPDTAPLAAVASAPALAPSPAAGTAPAASPAAGAATPAAGPAARSTPPARTAAAAAEAPATVVQAPLERVDSRVIIRRGDTLWRISRDTYGAGARYTVIYLANGDQIRDPDRIYPGQVFRVPGQ